MSKLDSWDSHVSTYMELPDVSNVEVNFPAIVRHIGECRGKVLLDYGCGGGRFSFRFEKLGAQVIGVDISLPMIQYACKTARPLGSLSQFLHMKDGTLTFLAADTVDIAVANLVFMMCSSKEQMAESMREIHRVLRRTGKFITVITHPCFIDRGAHDYRNVFPDGFNYMQEGYPYKFILQDANGNEVDNDFHDHHYTLSTYLQITLQSGFEIIGFEELTYARATIEKYGIPKEFQTFPQALLIESMRR